jgi:hypothetical protein
MSQVVGSIPCRCCLVCTNYALYLIPDYVIERGADVTKAGSPSDTDGGEVEPEADAGAATREQAGGFERFDSDWGLVRTGSKVARGLVDGISGLFIQPMEGAQVNRNTNSHTHMHTHTHTNTHRSPTLFFLNVAFGAGGIGRLLQGCRPWFAGCGVATCFRDDEAEKVTWQSLPPCDPPCVLCH